MISMPLSITQIRAKTRKFESRQEIRFDDVATKLILWTNQNMTLRSLESNRWRSFQLLLNRNKIIYKSNYKNKLLPTLFLLLYYCI